MLPDGLMVGDGGDHCRVVGVQVIMVMMVEREEMRLRLRGFLVVGSAKRGCDWALVLAGARAKFMGGDSGREGDLALCHSV